jgi:hypothetical protein
VAILAIISSGMAPGLVDIHAGDENTSEYLKFVIIGIYPGVHLFLIGVYLGIHLLFGWLPSLVGFQFGQHFFRSSWLSLMSLRLAFAFVWLASVFACLVLISAIRHAIICSISIVWQYSFL